MAYYLGIDTSCYTTSCAIVDEHGQLIKESRKLLEVPQGKRGLQQSQMVFQHTRALSSLIETLPLDQPIVGIGVSGFPRREEDSYMPAFLVGLNVANSLGHCLKVPVHVFSHQENHIWAALREIGEVPEGPFLSLHLSGGTSEFVLCERMEGSGFKTTILGSSNDIAAGQLVDRIGVLMGMKFPAGPSMETLARKSKYAYESVLPVSVKDNEISFGGPYSAGVRWWEAQQLRPIDWSHRECFNTVKEAQQLASSVFQCIGTSLEKALEHILKTHPVSTLITAGGVMANAYLQDRLSHWGHHHDLDFLCVSPKYSADNASGNAYGAMIVEGERQ